jgi:hypothetical protein
VPLTAAPVSSTGTAAPGSLATLGQGTTQTAAAKLDGSFTGLDAELINALLASADRAQGGSAVQAGSGDGWWASQANEDFHLSFVIALA